MNVTVKKIVTFVFFLCLTALIEARQPYHASVTVGDISAAVSDPNLVDLSNDLKTASLKVLIPTYTPISPVSIDINLRGISIDAFFAANSTTLVLSIPQLGVSQTFTAATRDDSIKLFKDFIRDAGNHHQLLKAYARFSPIDPIAGNPNSLQAQMAQADYLLGHLSPLAGCDSCWCSQPVVHQYQTGFTFGRAFSRGFDTTIATMPLRYSYSPDLTWAFIVDAPISYTRNGGASNLFGSLALGFRYPITCDWSLTPILRFGAGGSFDLCTAGNFVSMGIDSVFNYKYRNFVFSLTDYVGYISSGNFWLSGINFNYHLHNVIFKNGFSITTCNGFTFLKHPFNFCFSFVDTAFCREHLYIKHYDEVDISLITNNILPCLDYDCLKLGFSYQWGQKGYKGYFFNMAYQF